MKTIDNPLKTAKNDVVWYKKQHATVWDKLHITKEYTNDAEFQELVRLEGAYHKLMNMAKRSLQYQQSL